MKTIGTESIEKRQQGVMRAWPAASSGPSTESPGPSTANQGQARRALTRSPGGRLLLAGIRLVRLALGGLPSDQTANQPRKRISHRGSGSGIRLRGLVRPAAINLILIHLRTPMRLKRSRSIRPLAPQFITRDLPNNPATRPEYKINRLRVEPTLRESAHLFGSHSPCFSSPRLVYPFRHERPDL